MLSSSKLTSFPPYLLLFITVEGYLCRSCEKILDEKKKKKDDDDDFVEEMCLKTVKDNRTLIALLEGYHEKRFS